MDRRSIELVFFEGCPNAEHARENLRTALGSTDGAAAWKEWDLLSESTPERFREYGSPTVLVNGVDVTGEGLGNAAMACRADGAPPVSSILEGLLGEETP